MAYSTKASAKEREGLLADIVVAEGKKIGPAMSKAVYDVFS